MIIRTLIVATAVVLLMQNMRISGRVYVVGTRLSRWKTRTSVLGRGCIGVLLERYTGVYTLESGTLIMASIFAQV